MKILMPFDKVVYTGEKFREDLKGKIGVVTSRVHNQENTFVIDYGKDAFVFGEAVLNHWKPSSKEEKIKVEQEIYFRKKRKSDDD